MESNDGVRQELANLWRDVDEAIAQTSTYGVEANVEAEGVRYATELMRLALTLHFHNQDPDRPMLTEMIGPTLRWGWDNPYTTYHYAPVRGDRSYRLHGRRNTSTYLGVTVYGGGDERSGSMPTSLVGSINDTAIAVTDDGRWSVDVVPAGTPSAGDAARLELDPDATSIFVRQYVSDPLDEVFATVHIEPAEPAGPPPPLDEALLTQRVLAARAFFAAMWGMSHAIMSTVRDGAINEFHPPLAGGFDPQGRPSGLMYPTFDNLYVFGRYALADGEALVVTVKPPPCRYWSFYLGSEFQQSHPYGLGYGLITHETAHREPDGTVRFVISADDPGLPNWLPLQHHPRGMMAMRWLLPEVEDSPIPHCELTSLENLTDGA